MLISGNFQNIFAITNLNIIVFNTILIAMEFVLEEKMAMLKMIDTVMHSDSEVHAGELEELNYLMGRIGFKENLILESRKLSNVLCLNILKGMS